MDDQSQQPIKFTASFPPIKSAIIISGDGSGLQIKLDIPEVEFINAIRSLAMRETAFQVTLTPLTDNAQTTQNRRKTTY